MTDRVDRIRQLFAGTAVRLVSSQDVAAISEPCWSYQALTGRLTEISGVGAVTLLTTAMGLVLDAQLEGEPVAWITLSETSFYPPDAADSGIDLDALAVVKVDTAYEAGCATERLARSGAFGLIVLDLGKDARIPIALQGRLVSLAKRHDTALLCLTHKSGETASLGSMVSLRAEAMRSRVDGGHFRSTVSVVKDKCRGPNWSHSEVVRAPAGLR